MKITFVLPTIDLSGGVRVVATYADRLKKRGHEVYVVYPPEPPLKLSQQIKSLLKGHGWRSVNNNKRSHFDSTDVRPHAIECGRPITDNDVPDADVIIATWWETAEWVANLSDSKGAKAYFIQHHEVFDYLPKERVEATWLLPLHKITISQWLVDLARDQYGDHNVSFVPNSVETKQFYAPPRSKQLVPTIGTIYYGGSSWKGGDISLKAFSIAAQNLPRLRLVAFGWCNPSLELPLPEGTRYIQQPAQEVLRDIYASCDAWLFASRSEGFGLPILEAMACRTPVIGTSVGAAPELLADGAGMIVKPEDPEGMAKAIEKICKLSHKEWQAMSDTAYTKATSYTWEDATELFEAALQTAIDRSKNGDLSSLCKL